MLDLNSDAVAFATLTYAMSTETVEAAPAASAAALSATAATGARGGHEVQ